MKSGINNYPLVSIMIPTYNQQDYIAEAIESALAQDYENLEVVLTDDCSSDATGKIAGRFTSDPRFRYVRNENNLGRVGNYHHTAHNVARGEWIVNLDGDDYYTSSSFVREAMEAIINLNNQNIVAYCYRHNIDKIESLVGSERINGHCVKISGKDYFLNYYRIGSFGHPNIIYRRDIGLKIGMYLLPYQACDFHSIIRIILLGDILLDNRDIAYWRVHGGNCSVVELENKQKHAMLTFDAIQDFAKDYCSDAELLEWRHNMNKSSYRDYVIAYTTYIRSRKALSLLMKNFRFKYVYFRLLCKQVLGI